MEATETQETQAAPAEVKAEELPTQIDAGKLAKLQVLNGEIEKVTKRRDELVQTTQALLQEINAEAKIQPGDTVDENITSPTYGKITRAPKQN